MIAHSHTPTMVMRLLLLLAAGVLAAEARAQLPATQLQSIVPPGGQQGSTVDVSVAGGNLDAVHALRFSHPDIAAHPRLEEAGQFEPARPIPGKFRVEIGADVPPGVYEARAAGRFGVSNPRAFVVGRFFEMSDGTGNGQPDKAVEMLVNQTVNGVIDRDSRDYFRFELDAGQRVSIDCSARRIDSRLIGSLVLSDAAERELARARGEQGEDPFLDFTAPHAGVYYVGLSDFLYRGGGDYFYRLTVHDAPRIDFIFPPSGYPGSTAEFTLYGRNLPGGKPSSWTVGRARLDALEVTIPVPAADASTERTSLASPVLPHASFLDSFALRHKGADPCTIFLAAAPVIAEKKSNNVAADAQTVVVPTEVVGQFYPAGDTDWVQFQATKGDVYIVEVFAHRLGRAVDPRLLIQQVTRSDGGKTTVRDVAKADDSKNRNQRIGADFDTSSDDPLYRLTADADAIYRVMLWDQFGGSSSDPRDVYRLVIRKPNPDFRLVAIPMTVQTPPNANAVALGAASVRQGGTAVLSVRAERQDGFDGPIMLRAEGLPQGLRCQGATILPGETKTDLVFEAPGDAAAWAGSIRITGTSHIRGEPVVREARGGTVVWGTGNRRQDPPVFRQTCEVAFAVIEEVAPVSLEAEADQVWETSVGGAVDIPLTVTRRRDFKGDLKFVCQNLPKQIKPADLTVKADSNQATLTVKVPNGKTPPGDYTFFLRADSRSKFVRNASAVALAKRRQSSLESKIKELEEAAKLASGDGGQAGGAEQRAADEAAVESERYLEQVRQLKADADKQLESVKKANAPKDFNFVTFSTPIRLKVFTSPFNVALEVPRIKVRPGETANVPLRLTRRFGFAEDVKFFVEPPAGIAGLSVPMLTVTKEAESGQLELSVAGDTPPGNYTLIVRATSKFNKVDVGAETEIAVEVEKDSRGER